MVKAFISSIEYRNRFGTDGLQSKRPFGLQRFESAICFPLAFLLTLVASFDKSGAS